jgi:non-specific serine/threonine protein kinase
MGTNLPRPRTVLVGRELENDELAEAVSTAAGKLVTITGCGGSGKTSLAIEVGRGVLPKLADGVWFVDLARVASADAISAAVCAALGVADSGDAPADRLASFVAHREMLLVLDNCEHLIDAVAALADEILDASTDLRILATSREPLRISGEQVFALAPLAIPTARPDNASDLDGYPSVTLFLERARAAAPDLALTDENAAAVAEICCRLDGIPLALELAAVRASTMTLESLADRLADGFDLLIAKARSRPERQQTMRAVLEWSHALLSAEEQIVLRRLGVFPGSWTLSAAEKVCAEGGVDVVLVLGELVDKSLVVRTSTAGEARYRLLAPVREYAAGKLAASGEHELVHGRHCAFFVALAEEAESELHRADQVAWIHRLDEDLDNVRLAVRTGLARGDADSVLRLTGGLWWYVWQRGHMREGVTWVDPALTGPEVPGDVRVRGLRAAGMWHGSLGHHERATELETEMLELATASGDLPQVARAETMLGIERLRAGDVAGTRPHFERALAAAREADDPMMVGNALVNLGHVAAQDRGPGDAEALFGDGLVTFEASGDRWGVAYASNYLATLRRGAGDHAGAVELSARAVGLLEELGDRFYLVFAVEDLSRALAGAGRSVTAARLFGAAESIRRTTGALLSPGAREEYASTLAGLEKAIGVPACGQARNEGARMSLIALLDEATAPPPRGNPAALAGPNGALTRRETQVARLLAAGMTNKEIAAELVIAVGTAGIHTERILRKLDLRSRHQVADWGRVHGLWVT